MDRDDIEGAKAAAEYFLALYPYVYATGDLEAWREMSHPECEFCRSTADDVSEVFGNGGYGLGGAFAIEDVVATPPDEEYPHFRVSLEGVEEPSSVYTPDKGINESPGGPSVYHVAVRKDGSSWLVLGALARSEEQ